MTTKSLLRDEASQPDTRCKRIQRKPVLSVELLVRDVLDTEFGQFYEVAMLTFWAKVNRLA